MSGFDQRVFGAALMSVCGRSATTPVVPMVAAADTPPAQGPLIEFLSMRRETLSCADIPPDVAVDGLDGMQRASRYLTFMAASAWTLAGPTWVGIDRLLGLLYGLAIVFAYLLCRVWMPRPIAIGVATLLTISPLHLANLPDLRDYSKAPFFLASLLVIGWRLVMRRRPASIVVGLSAAAGALLGFGFGVRTDIVVNLVVVLVAIVGFLPERVADTWRVRLVAAVVCVLAFTAVAWPILNSRASGSNIWHWALLGYAHEWDNALDVAPGPYEPSYFYDDSYVATTVDAYWGRVTGGSIHMSVGVPQYADASRAYYLSILTTFPADAWLRGWASVIKILELPYSGTQSIPRGVLPGWLERASALEQRVLVHVTSLAVALFAIVVLMVSARSVRLATLMFGMVAFLGAYPAIQFQRRHIFHLEVLSLWTAGFAVSFVLSPFLARVSGAQASRAAGASVRARAWHPLVFGPAVVILVILPLTTLRAYQQRAATTLFNTYGDARIAPIDIVPERIGNGIVRVARGQESLSRPRGQRSMYSDVLVAEVSASGCGIDRAVLTFRYVAKNPSIDFTRTYDIDVPVEGQPTRMYFPIYETGAASPDPQLLVFGGLDVAESELPCVTRIGRFVDPDRFPLLLPVVLRADWRGLPLHQTLRGWEGDPLHDGRTLSYWAPGSLRNRRASLIARHAAVHQGHGGSH